MISVVIPTFNAAPTLGDQLRALGRQTYRGDWEVIVADNGSTDRGVAIAESMSGEVPSLRVVDASQRRGPSAARNLGAEVAEGAWLAFTDADDAVLPSWLDGVVAGLEAGASIVTGPVWGFPVDDPVPTKERSSGDPLVHLGFLPYALGTNMALPRAVFESTGRFHEDQSAGEDVDLSWRVQLDHGAMEFVPRAQVAKRQGRGSSDTLRRFFRYGVGDARLLRAFGAAGLRREPTDVVARAYLGILARVPLLWQERTREQWLRQVGRRAGRVVGSVRNRCWVL